MALAKTFLAIGIAIIFAVFVGYGLYVLYEVPKYDSRINCNQKHDCDQMIVDCSAQYNSSDPKYHSCGSDVLDTEEYKNCLKLRRECNEDFRKQAPRYIHSRNSFYILVVLGILSIIAGTFLAHLEGIGSGLIGGGVLIVLWSLAYTWNYWSTLNKYVKLATLGIVLAVLVYFGYKKLEKKLNK